MLLPRMALQLSSLVFHVGELVEHAVQRLGLAWPRPEDPGDAIGQPVRMAGPAASQASRDCLPRKFRGMMSRMSVPKKLLSGIPRAVKKATLPTRTACSMRPGRGCWRRCRVGRAAIIDVHGRDREIRLVVGVGAREPSSLMATPLGRLPVWRRQSTLSPAVFRMLSWPVAGSTRWARNG